MGGISDAPYIYDAPSQQRIAYPYSQFNPKAVTQAEAEKAKRRSQQSAKPKQEGPLINFNQHPDSYMIVGGRQPDFKPMSPKTKRNVTVVRWIQFAHRILNEIGALGLLVCSIITKGMVGAERWLFLIPTAFDALITLYGIYHLVRPAKSRTPSSSASYHFFALILDVGLLVFYVIIALFAHNNWIEPAGTSGRWRSFFDDASTDLILQVSFLGAVGMGGLHLACAMIDLYLVIVFRKISNLPPDMNPLEDNLTSRKSIRGHKYKNSDASALSGSTVDVSSEKHRGYLSGSTLSLNNQSRISVAKDGTEVRQMEFRNSRANSDYTFSPHNPQSARLSRQQYDDAQTFYQQDRSARNSTRDFGDNYGNRHSRAGSISPAKNHTFDSSLEIPMPTMMSRDESPRPGSFATARSRPQDSPGRYQHGNAKSVSSLHLPASATAESQALVKTQQKEGLLSNGDSNWYSLDDEEDENDRSDLGNPRPQFVSERYQDSPSTPKHASASVERHDSFEPMPSPIKPLGMHPPSPATKAKFSPQHDRYDSGFEPQATHLVPRPQAATMHSRTDSNHSENSGATHQLAVAKMYQAQRFQREREAQRTTPTKHDRHDSFEPNSQLPSYTVPNLPVLTRDPPTPPRIHESTRLMRNMTPDPEDDLDNDDETSSLNSANREECEADESKLGVHRSNTSATAASSSYSESAPSLMTTTRELAKGVGTPKGKYYGDLSAAMAAVRGSSTPTGRGGRGNGGYQGVPQQHNSRGEGSPVGRVPGKGSPYYNSGGAYDAPAPPRKSPGRVVSRTGVDIADAMLYGSDAGHRHGGIGGWGPRRREVSGKVAEEGRSGGW